MNGKGMRRFSITAVTRPFVSIMPAMEKRGRCARWSSAGGDKVDAYLGKSCWHWRDHIGRRMSLTFLSLPVTIRIRRLTEVDCSFSDENNQD